MQNSERLNLQKVPKIAIFARQTQLWEAIEIQRAELQRKAFSPSTNISICYEENEFCFSSYGIQFLATF